MHPDILRALAAARIDDLRRLPPYRPAHERVRRKVGWFLVELGLRIATPRPAA